MLKFWLCAALLLPGLAWSAAAPAELQKKARARMKSLDFEAALPLLEQLRDLPGVDPGLKASGLVDLGVTFVNLGRADDARKAFDAALEANPEVALPSSVPPKIRKLFEEAKEARVAATAPPPAALTVAEPPPQRLAPPAPVAEVKIPLEPAPPRRERMKAVPLVLVGAGVLAIGAGVSTAYASQNANRVLVSALHSSADASALQSRRSSMAIASTACYGAGAALGLIGAALFAFSGPGLGGGSVAAMVTPDFGALTVRGEF